jgi:3-oxoacyl-[acyl-carrier protein] reductase
MRFEGRVAIVTGAGQGIGKEYAARLLREGAQVAIAELSEERGRAGLQELQELGDVILVPTDVSDEDSTLQCAKTVHGEFGRIDALVNNAALFQDLDKEDHSYEYTQRAFQVNLHGAWLMGRAVAPYMVEQRWGRIINQSSGAAYSYLFPPMDFTGLGNYSYSITKWGVVGLTKFMAAQLGQYNITVNCIAPGITMTEATKKVVPEEFLGGMTAMTAMKQRLEPEDLAGAAVFFASDDGKFCTGQTLVIDGGLAMPA